MSDYCDKGFPKLNPVDSTNTNQIKELTPRDFAGALGHAETAIKFAIQYLEKQNSFDAMRVLKDAEKKIEILAPMDIKDRT